MLGLMEAAGRCAYAHAAIGRCGGSSPQYATVSFFAICEAISAPFTMDFSFA